MAASILRSNAVETMELTPTRGNNFSQQESSEDKGEMLGIGRAADTASRTILHVTHSTKSKRLAVVTVLLIATVGLVLGIVIWRLSSKKDKQGY